MAPMIPPAHDDDLDEGGLPIGDHEDRVHDLREALTALLWYVEESWYARNFVVPSGVIERSHTALSRDPCSALGCGES